jgi:Tol biopolymer transport system component
MSELRERFKALDDLDVPDVMARARIMGPKPPEPDRAPPLRRVGALVFAAVVAVAAVVLIARALDEPARPGDRPTPTPTDTALRRDGEVITYTNDDPRRSGDLVAQDPDTGAVRTLVAADELSQPLGEDDFALSGLLIGSAAWSADGRWVAFEVVACGGGVTDEAGAGGLWVTNGLDEPRQLTRPCFEDPDVAPYNELWAWSPAGAQLVVARISVDGDSLVLIDPTTGDRTDLGETAGRVTTLTWSPDGTRITYGALGGGGSVYSVGTGGGEHSLLASELGRVSNQGVVFGWGIRWSPDGAHFVVQTYGNEGPMNKLLLMNADGSDVRQLSEDFEVEGAYWSPGLSWSPDGTRMAYATFSEGRGQIWVESPDGSDPSLLFESAPAPFDTLTAGSPVWSPDGTRIAFGSATTDGEAVYLVANADGTGDPSEIDELRYLSWRGGWYFCECYG